MIYIYILLVLIFIVLVLLWCPVYIHFYFKEALSIKVKFLLFTFNFPSQRTKKRRKKEPEVTTEAQKIQPPPAKKENIFLSLIREKGIWGFLSLLKTTVTIISGSAKKLYEKMHIKAFNLAVIVVGEDAADTAIKYGQAQAVVSVATSVLLQGVDPDICQVHVVPGFSQKTSSVDFYAKVYFFPASVLKITICALFDFVKDVYTKTNVVSNINKKGKMKN